MSCEQYTVQKFLAYVEKSRAKNTLIMYQEGLKRFAEWYKPDVGSWQEAINEVLKERVSDWTSASLSPFFAYMRSVCIRKSNYETIMRRAETTGKSIGAID